MTGEISFVELGTGDAGRAREFYSALFGWTFMPGPSGDGAGFDISGLGTAAGIHEDYPSASPYLFFRVDDLDASVAKVTELGGTVEDMDVDGDHEQIARYGRFKTCTDSQGSPFGLHQPPEA